MRIIISEEYEECFTLLKSLSVPYYLQKVLEHDYNSTDPFYVNNIQKRIEQFGKNMQMFAERNEMDIVTIGSPRNNKSVFSDVAKESSLYFRQGLEMLETSKKMSDETSPLVEYYGFLQCVKGVANALLDLIDPDFFGYHGITPDRESEKPYIEIVVKKSGVFQTILFINNASDDLEKYYLNRDYRISLQEMIKEIEPSLAYAENNPPIAFIGSFMLSCLVRYKIKTWKKILNGIEDDIFIKIDRFRNGIIPKSLFGLFKLLYVKPPTYGDSIFDSNS